MAREREGETCHPATSDVEVSLRFPSPILESGPQGAQAPPISSNNQINGHWSTIRTLAGPAAFHILDRSQIPFSLLPCPLLLNACFLSVIFGSQHTTKQTKGSVHFNRCHLRSSFVWGRRGRRYLFIQDHFFLIKQMCIHLENREIKIYK